jgi:hypothetical protein
MKNKRSKKFNKTEESVFTLFSLYVLIAQAFEALTNKEDILLSDFDEAHHSFEHLVNDTIHEALIFQILLRTCSFLDEWNKVFGVLTEPEDKDRIIAIKRVAKPAYKCISEWKNLRDFRNEVIAHNHRNKGGKNIYLEYLPYNSPQSNGEVYLLVFCLKKMIDVVHYSFEDMVKLSFVTKLKNRKTKPERIMSTKKIKDKIKQVDEEISFSLARIHLLSKVIDKNVSVTILH